MYEKKQFLGRTFLLSQEVKYGDECDKELQTDLLCAYDSTGVH